MFRVNELAKAAKGRLISRGKDRAIMGISIDTRSIHPNDAFIAIKGSNFNGHDFIDEAIKKGASCVIKEAAGKVTKKADGVTFIEVEDTVKALGDIAQFQRKKFNVPVIAITGSNGKTTTKEMVAHVLSRRFNVLKNEGTKNNQIGLPLTLLNLNSSHDIVVLEVGTNHFGEVEYLANICQPNIGIITNIGPSHLEYFGDLEGVFREKYKMAESLIRPYIGILNADDDLLKSNAFVNPGENFILSFGVRNNCDFSASRVKSLTDKIEFYVNKKYKFTLNSPGYYNIYNALAAITVARIFGIAYKDIILRLSNLDFPKSRLKFLELKNVKFIDDTYNSNPVSLKQALKVLADFKTAGRKILVMGDMLELGRTSESFHYEAGELAARCCDILITVGNLSKLAAKAATALRSNDKGIFVCQTAAEARKILFDNISPCKGDLVLVKGSRRMSLEEILKD